MSSSNDDANSRIREIFEEEAPRTTARHNKLHHHHRRGEGVTARLTSKMAHMAANMKSITA